MQELHRHMIYTMTSGVLKIMSHGRQVPAYILIEARNVDSRLLSNSKRTPTPSKRPTYYLRAGFS